MKSVLMSIKPKWCELIAQGKKTIEVRKTRPKIKTPFKCYIYMTKKNTKNDIFWKGWFDDAPKINGKVIGEFVCSTIIEVPKQVNQPFWLHSETKIPDKDYISYLGNKNGYGWHISDLVIYDKPKELSEFRSYSLACYDSCMERVVDIIECEDCTACHIKRPPQSWCYVESLT